MTVRSHKKNSSRYKDIFKCQKHTKFAFPHLHQTVAVFHKDPATPQDPFTLYNIPYWDSEDNFR